MKKYLLWIFCAVGVLFTTVSPLLALPVPRSDLGRESIIAAQDLGAWSVGIATIEQEREVNLFGTGLYGPMKQDKLMGYVGYDVLSWLTAYVVAGNSKTRIGWGNTPSGKGEFGFGLMFNLINTEILDPTTFEDRLKLNANIQYTSGKTELAGEQEVAWKDLSGAITLSLVNDIDGQKFFLPNAIALFVGPAFSYLNSSSIEAKSSFGFTAGMEVFLNEKVALELSYIKYEQSCYSAGVSVRF
jgi:opacity protein-like surface antigen